MKKSDAAKLLKAAALLREVTVTLNTEKGPPCVCCGLRKAENWPDALVNKELDASITKLTRLADSFERDGI